MQTNYYYRSFGCIHAQIGPSAFYHPDIDQIRVYYRLADTVYSSVRSFVPCSGTYSRTLTHTHHQQHYHSLTHTILGYDSVNIVIGKILAAVGRNSEKVEDKIVQISGNSYLFILNGTSRTHSLTHSSSRLLFSI